LRWHIAGSWIQTGRRGYEGPCPGARGAKPSKKKKLNNEKEVSETNIHNYDSHQHVVLYAVVQWQTVLTKKGGGGEGLLATPIIKKDFQF